MTLLFKNSLEVSPYIMHVGWNALGLHAYNIFFLSCCSRFFCSKVTWVKIWGASAPPSPTPLPPSYKFLTATMKCICNMTPSQMFWVYCGVRWTGQRLLGCLMQLVHSVVKTTNLFSQCLHTTACLYLVMKSLIKPNTKDGSSPLSTCILKFFYMCPL